MTNRQTCSRITSFPTNYSHPVLAVHTPVVEVLTTTANSQFSIFSELFFLKLVRQSMNKYEEITDTMPTLQFPLIAAMSHRGLQSHSARRQQFLKWRVNSIILISFLCAIVNSNSRTITQFKLDFFSKWLNNHKSKASSEYTRTKSKGKWHGWSDWHQTEPAKHCVQNKTYNTCLHVFLFAVYWPPSVWSLILPSVQLSSLPSYYDGLCCCAAMSQHNHWWGKCYFATLVGCNCTQCLVFLEKSFFNCPLGLKLEVDNFFFFFL